MVLGFSSVAEFVVAHPPPRPATAAKLNNNSQRLMRSP